MARDSKETFLIAVTVKFMPSGRTAAVAPGTTLLDAAGQAGLTVTNLCGGAGICGRCRMRVTEGSVEPHPSHLLNDEESAHGMVLACRATVRENVVVDIPEETLSYERIEQEKGAERFRAIHAGTAVHGYDASPLTDMLVLRISPPSPNDQRSDVDRFVSAISQARPHVVDAAETSRPRAERRDEDVASGNGIVLPPALLQILPRALRENDFQVGVTLSRVNGSHRVTGIRGTAPPARNFIAVCDVGTSTVVCNLVDAASMETVAAKACFNSQSIHGRDVTARMMACEKKGMDAVRRPLLEDINRLISSCAGSVGMEAGDVTALLCAGNTIMTHFVLGLPPDSIRREPYTPVSTAPAPVDARSAGIGIAEGGLLHVVPGISGWVGGDITAGILATGLDEMEKPCMLIDIGTNGEIVVGNREWLMACSASTGPALEGASVECGMMAEPGAIEGFDASDIRRARVIGNVPPRGLCGSGIIDLISVLLHRGIVDRSGRFVDGSSDSLEMVKGQTRFVLFSGKESGARAVYLTQDDVRNIITAKAAVFAAAKILLDRVDLTFADIDRLFVAGGLGSFIDREHAVAIGLLPDLPLSRLEFAGNTSMWGAKLAALSGQAFDRLGEIAARTTYYDLMGAADYVEQFRQAMFLPHTDLGLFPSAQQRRV